MSSISVAPLLLGIVGVPQINDITELTVASKRTRVTRYVPVTRLADTRNEDQLTFHEQYRF